MAHKAVTDLAQWRAQQLEEMGGDGIPFTLTVRDEQGRPVADPSDPSGQTPKTETFVVPHPLSEIGSSEKFEAAAGSTASAKALLNTDADPEVFDRWVAYGGTAGDVMLAFRSMAKEMNAPKS